MGTVVLSTGGLFSALEVDGWLGGSVISETVKMTEVWGNASWMRREFLCFGCSDSEVLRRRWNVKKRSKIRKSAKKLPNNAVFKEGNKLYKVMDRFKDLESMKKKNAFRLKASNEFLHRYEHILNEGEWGWEHCMSACYKTNLSDLETSWKWHLA